MKGEIIKHILVSMSLILFVSVLLVGCSSQDKSEECRESNGIWYQDVCVGENSSEKVLQKAGLIEEHKNDLYEITVYYPYQVLKYPHIYSKLEKKVSDIKKEEGFPVKDKDINTDSYPWQLTVDMREFTSAGDLASVLIYTLSYTGGAHPNHYYESLNFNTNNQRIISLDDLFSDSKYIYELSKYVTDSLLKIKSDKTGEEIQSDEWIERGALPLSENFGIFVFVPNNDHTKIEGIKFIFPPYTVGPYSDGTYEVFVPAKAFLKFLKEDLRNSFV